MASARDKPASASKQRDAKGEAAARGVTDVRAPDAIRPSTKVPRSTKRSAVPGHEAAREALEARQATPGTLGATNASTTPARSRKPRASPASPVAPASPVKGRANADATTSDRAGGARPRPRSPNATFEQAESVSDRPTAARAARAGNDGGASAGPSASGSARAATDGAGHVMELHWGDDVPSSRQSGLVQRWVKRGNALLRHLAEHGAARHEVRADLKDGRFIWLDPEGRISAAAHAEVLCSWSPTTSSLSMAWANPLVRGVAVKRIEGLPAERDDIDEEAAWRVAMHIADTSHAEYLYRVNTPHAWYFLALSKLTFHPERTAYAPASPVGLVRRGLAEIRVAVESRAEPASVLRSRLASLGEALIGEAECAYRDTDWTPRLTRTGERLASLADALPPASFGGADVRATTEWLDRTATIDLSDAIAVIEDEWAATA